MKKCSSGTQTLNLNRIDFERAGSGRKAGYKFTIEFVQGRVANVISGSSLASDLALALLQDPPSRVILACNDVDISLNTKFQLTIVNRCPQEAPSGSSNAKDDASESENS